jgi:hypothetical protein
MKSSFLPMQTSRSASSTQLFPVALLCASAAGYAQQAPSAGDLAKSGAIKKTPDRFTYIDPAQFHEPATGPHHGARGARRSHSFHAPI